MPLTKIDKQKAQKLIEKIERQDFDANDIDALFIRLREYAGPNRIFHEIADIVAHSEKGDKGLVRESVRGMHLSIKFFREYASQKKTLNISEPFPSYVWELMKYEIQKCDSDELVVKFGNSKKSLTKKIDKLFKYDKTAKRCAPRKQIPVKTFEAIQFLLGAIRAMPTFSADQIVDEMIQVFRRNHLTYSETAFSKSADPITLCVILLLHNRLNSYGGPNQDRCYITSDNPGRPLGETPYPLEAIDGNDFGCLAVRGVITEDSGEKEVKVEFGIVTTKLMARDWADDSLFVLEDIANTLADDFDHWYIWKFDTNTDLCINEDFKLDRLEFEEHVSD